MSKKVALYCRVSVADKQTTENQKFRLEQYANSKGYKFDIFEENESTRRTRPVKQALLEKLRRGEYSDVIVYKLDRWARSSTELILDTQELINKGIGFISVSDNLDFTTASGRLHFQILSAFSEFERGLISERTRESLARIKASKNGKKLGRPLGSKDKKPRRKSGYILREAKKKQELDEAQGIYKGIDEYL